MIFAPNGFSEIIIFEINEEKYHMDKNNEKVTYIILLFYSYRDGISRDRSNQPVPKYL